MKPIMLNEKQKNKILAEFAKYLENFKSNTGKLEYSCKLNDALNLKPRKPTVIFKKLAQEKIKYLVATTDSEIAWHGLVKKEKNIYIVTDIIVYPQMVTGTTVTTDDEAYTNWLNSLDNDTFNMLRLQGHSHVNMGISPSGVDMAYYDQLLKNLSDKNNDYYVLMIINKRENMFINVYDFEQNLIFEAEDIEVKIEGANPYKQWYEDAYKNIKTHKAVNTKFTVVEDSKKIKNAEIPGYTESGNYHVDTPAWYGNRYGYK